jgi:PAS domain S-box-containing protein
MLSQNNQLLELRKQEQKPFIFPVLLIANPAEIAHVQSFLGKSIDELVMMPIQKTELLARIEILLRLRWQSIESGKLKEELTSLKSKHTSLALAQTGIGLWDFNLSNGRYHYSTVWKKQLGFADDEIGNTAEEWESRLHPDDRSNAIEIQAAYLKNPVGTLSNEFRLRHKDGSYRWILSRASFLENDHGHKIRLLGSHIDITEKKLAEIELNRSEARFRTIFENSMAVMFLVDPETHRIVSANKAAEKFYGWTADELKRKRIDDINTLSPDEIKIEMEKARNSERIYFRFKHRISDGNERDVEVYASKIAVDGCDYLFSIIHDITEQVEAEQKLRHSEEKFRLIFESANVGKSLTLPNGLINVNHAFCEMLGYTKEELQNKRWQDLTPAEDVAPTEEKLKPMLAGETDSERFFKRYVHKNGSFVWVDISVRLIRDENRSPLFFITTLIDISAWKAAEESLAESENKYHHLFADNPMPMWIYDLETLRFLEVNEAATEHYGFSADEFKTMTLKDIRPVEEIDRLMKDVAVTHPVINRAGIWQHVKKGGEMITVEIISHLVTYENRQARLVLANDITDRKIAEAKVRESEANLYALINNTQDSIWSLDRNYNYIIFNKTYADIFLNRYGYPVQKGMNAKAPLLPEEVGFWESMFDAVFEGERKVFEFSYVLQGKLRHFQTSINPIYEDGVVTGASAMSVDITSVKQAVEALKESEERYRSIFENSSVAILLTTPDGTILSANDFACRIFDRTEQEICELGRKGLVDLTDPRLPLALKEREETGRAKGELTFLKKDGSKFECEFSTVVFTDAEGNRRTSLVLRDLTEQKQAEQEIRNLNLSLENKVEERTLQVTNANRELETKISEIERMNKLFVGRELRMVELKNRLKALENLLANR